MENVLVRLQRQYPPGPGVLDLQWAYAPETSEQLMVLPYQNSGMELKQ